jgi:hypothetical protein
MDEEGIIPSVKGKSSRLVGRFLLLPAVSGACSVLSFLSFVIFPSIWGTGPLRTFTEHNYVGGLYTFVIACSAMPIALYLDKSDDPGLMAKYFVISLCGVLLLLPAVWLLGCSGWGYVCILAAVSIHLIGLSTAMLILENRLLRAALFQVVRPLLFAGALFAAVALHSPIGNWVIPYTATAAPVALACVFFNPKLFRAGIRRVAFHAREYRDILLRMVACLSFSLYFQVELIFCGKLTALDVGVYAMIQKLYSSISISLFSTLGVFLLAGYANADRTRRKRILALFTAFSILSGCLVLAGGFAISHLRSGHSITATMIAAASVLSVVFTIANFINLYMSTFSPGRGLASMSLAIVAFLGAFFLFRPKTYTVLMADSGIYFASDAAFSQMLRMLAPGARKTAPAALVEDLSVL